MKELYMNYSSFELVCWDADGKNTNISISLTVDQVKNICRSIGLLGFATENNEIVGYWKKK